MLLREHQEQDDPKDDDDDGYGFKQKANNN